MRSISEILAVLNSEVDMNTIRTTIADAVREDYITLAKSLASQLDTALAGTGLTNVERVVAIQSLVMGELYDVKTNIMYYLPHAIVEELMIE